MRSFLLVAILEEACLVTVRPPRPVAAALLRLTQITTLGPGGDLGLAFDITAPIDGPHLHTAS